MGDCISFIDNGIWKNPIQVYNLKVHKQSLKFYYCTENHELKIDMENIQKLDPVILESKHNNRPFSIDITYQPDGMPKPIILHIHGFKGFKDWGYFNQLAEYAAMNGFVFIKMNFSHNGTTPENPLDFVDLEAFGSNNFSIEQSDLATVIDYVYSSQFVVDKDELDLGRFYLTGHSRGGAAVVLKGFHDPRVKAVASWAGINDLSKHFSITEVDQWKEKGVMYIENSRTKQLMPLYYQIVEDFLENKDILNLPQAIKNFMKPLCIIHGSKDPTVPVRVAYLTQKWNPNVELHIVEGADHVFNGGHPWNSHELPENVKTVMNLTMDFFNSL
jgi:dipeptidyl aminopeptidase/acylaminoacyl peptidase